MIHSFNVNFEFLKFAKKKWFYIVKSHVHVTNEDYIKLIKVFSFIEFSKVVERNLLIP